MERLCLQALSTGMTDSSTAPRDDRGQIKDRKHSVFTYASWLLLLGAAGYGLFTQSWNMLFLSGVVFVLTLLPFFLESLTDLRLPRPVIGLIALFVVGTIFLGEVANFYERFWWWDIFMHTGSAIGFGLIGTVVALLFIGGDRVEAPPVIGAIMAFSFALAIGALWEIFEFGMDQIFGLNMQKSSLVDTMSDLIVDSIGALIGAFAGYVYLKRGKDGVLSGTIDQFVEDNPHMFDDADSASA